MDPSGGECNIKVVCRFRPLNGSEERAGSNFIAKFPQGSEDALSIGVSHLSRPFTLTSIRSCHKPLSLSGLHLCPSVCMLHLPDRVSVVLLCQCMRVVHCLLSLSQSVSSWKGEQ